MAEKKIHKGIRFPPSIIKWLSYKMKKSGRTFSAEVVHQLTLVMERVKK